MSGAPYAAVFPPVHDSEMLPDGAGGGASGADAISMEPGFGAPRTRVLEADKITTGSAVPRHTTWFPRWSELGSPHDENYPGMISTVSQNDFHSFPK